MENGEAELLEWALENWPTGTAADKQRITDRLGEAFSQTDVGTAALAFYARCLDELGYAELSLSVYERILNLEPTNALYWRNLGWLQLDAGNCRDAQHSFETAIQLSNDATAHIGCAVALSTMNMDEQAQTHWRAALALEPENDEALLGLAKNIGVADRATSQALLQKAVEIDPESCANLRELALTLENWDAMVAMLNRAIRIDPNDFWARVYLGSTLLRTNRPAEALESLDAADELADNASEFVYTLKSRAYEELGDETNALKYRKLASKSDT